MENNRLIAEFMGIPKCDRFCTDCGFYKFGAGVYYLPEQMGYRRSWDWLMPVVEKIQHNWEVDICRTMDFEINSTGWNGYKTTVRISILLLKTGNPYETIKTTANDRMDAVYDAVVEFINWYNNAVAGLAVEKEGER